MTKTNLVRGLRAALLASALGAMPTAARADDNAEAIAALRQELAALRAEVAALRKAQAAPEVVPLVTATPVQATPVAPAAPVVAVAAKPAPAPKKAWYEKLQLRGYVQMRANEVLSGDMDAPAGVSRLRSVHDSAVGERGNFSLRRARLVVQGDVSERLSLYLQGDLAAAVNNQSNGERRENFFQMRDAYADLNFAHGQVKLRFGQSKVPFGWENLQSSSNRITLDRADAANSAVPGERDLGVVAYYTPPKVQAVWDRLAKDGQKLFGNYGAFGVGVFNGQGINRTEKNDGLMKVALATWPIELDGLGAGFKGQVLEVGVQGMLNTVQPELRTGGVSATAFEDNRVNVHAVLYPAPFGIQAEWTWGRSPEWNAASQAIASGKLNGGYVQGMYRIRHSPVGQIIPYARWQHFEGGWKAATNAPRIRTDELELGVEWQPRSEFELTVAYARMKRTEADERRSGQARGDLLRAQVQWNY
jgi:phosphate-selective porin